VIIAPQDATKPLLLYFDANNRLQVGTWGTQVTAANIAYFKFASVVGFTMTGDYDSWDMADIKFEPSTTKATTYANIPAWDTYSSTKPAEYSLTTNAHFISTTVHTLANVKLGMGDPCQLVGFTGAEVNNRITLPTSSYRLPTTRENDTFIGYTGTPTTDNIGLSYVSIFGSSPQVATFTSGNALPAVGYRTTDGFADGWGSNGLYWSATPVDDSTGYYLRFSSGYIFPSNVNGAQTGFVARCVPQ
jgi:hypothetical protein